MKVELLMTIHGLCIEFENCEYKEQFLKDMHDKAIDMFTEEKGNNYCYVVRYNSPAPLGVFISKQQCLGLAFMLESQKFYFIERIGLPDDCYLDMGPGYDNQLYFNPRKFSCKVGEKLCFEQETDNDSYPKFRG